MIITNSFVWINYPKTGSTFVRDVLRQIYTKIESDSIPSREKTIFGFKDIIKKIERKIKDASVGLKAEIHLGNKQHWMFEVLHPELRPSTGDRYGRPTPHGTISQIPDKYSNLPIVSAIRNPVGRYISTYNYADWKRFDQLPDSMESILSYFPDFPNLDFNTFLAYINHYYKIGKCVVGEDIFDVGPLSYDFLSFFTKNALTENKNFYFGNWNDLIQIKNKVTFLKFSSLNINLYHFLLECGFNQADISFILDKEPLNESSKKCIISSSSENSIKEKEWLLYKIFNEF